MTWPTGQINMRATALVFTTLLSIVPLLAFSFIILRQFGGHGGRDLQPIVLEFFRPVGAGADEMTRAGAAVRRPPAPQRGRHRRASLSWSGR